MFGTNVRGELFIIGRPEDCGEMHHSGDVLESGWGATPVRRRSPATLSTPEGACFPARTRAQQDFLGFMLYNRLWFDKDRYGFTLGGGKINNPGRYLVLLPLINGATAASGTPYFTENPGDP